MVTPKPEPALYTSEWLKIIASVLSGVVVGVCVEPIKQGVLRWFTTRRCIAAICREIGRTYYMVGVFAEWDAITTEVAGRITFEDFDYYYDQHREAFYRIPHHAEIRGLYRGLKLTLLQCAAGKCNPRLAMLDIKNSIDTLIELRHLDGRRIRAVADTHQTQMAVESTVFTESLKRMRGYAELLDRDI